MPLGKHYGGHGREVMASMTKEYGSKKGKQVFYATENKRKQDRTVMGRKVVHHSPDKHPESTDAQVDFDKLMQRAEEGKTSGSYGGMRKDLQPIQKPSPTPARGLMEYIKKLGGGYK